MLGREDENLFSIMARMSTISVKITTYYANAYNTSTPIYWYFEKQWNWWRTRHTSASATALYTILIQSLRKDPTEDPEQ